VNIQTKEVTVNVNGKYEKILKRSIHGLSRKYKINDDIFEKIEDILSDRDYENCQNVKNC
jgi:hypothetical protein